jgi:hypothetical protein
VIEKTRRDGFYKKAVYNRFFVSWTFTVPAEELSP